MKLLQNQAVVGILVVAAVATVLWRLWPKRRGASPPVSLQIVASAPVRPLAASTNKASAEPSTQSVAPRPSEIDLPIVQSNLLQWTESPRRDPFQMRLKGGKQPGAYPSARELLTLSAVWRQSGSGLAVINSRVVSEGDTILGFRVETIGTEHVWVNGPNGREEVSFRYHDSQRADFEYRIIGGETNDINTANGWYNCRGKIQQVISPGSYVVLPELENSQPSLESEGQSIIVKNVPLDRAEGDLLPSIRCKYVGNEPITDATGTKRTKHAYDYGVPCDPPKAAVDRHETQKAFLLQQYAEASTRHAEFDIDAAESGNPSAQYILGRRYLDGESVPKDETEARRWLEKSAAQGNSDAQATLKELESRIFLYRPK